MNKMLDLESDRVRGVRMFCNKRIDEFEKCEDNTNVILKNLFKADALYHKLAELLDDKGHALLDEYTACMIFAYDADCKYHYRLGYMECNEEYDIIFDPKKDPPHNKLYKNSLRRREYISNLKGGFGERKAPKKDSKTT